MPTTIALLMRPRPSSRTVLGSRIASTTSAMSLATVPVSQSTCSPWE